MASLDQPDFRLLVRDFSPGYMDQPESDTIPPGATPDALNGFFYSEDPGGGIRRAIMGKRPGHRCVNPTAIDLGSRIEALIDFRRIGANPVLLAVCNERLWAFDNTDAFTQIGGSAYFAAGKRVRHLLFKDNVFLFDGVTNRRYNGTDVLGDGEARPTSAPGLATAAGPGVTGTYEGYVCWYDPTMDHETSGSDVSAAVAFANQQREWTKPTGAPAANYTQWRIYCRRTDTNEFNFYKVADVAIGTATHTEAVSDTTRRQAGLGPFSSAHDVPPAFAFMAEWLGYGFGVPEDSSDFYVTAVGDLQSVNPAHRFGVTRGDGQAVRSIKPYGDLLLLHKDHKTFVVEGTQVPFVPRQLHSSWGNMSQESGIEVDGLFYAWDRDKGPYVTDTVNFTSLAYGRVRSLLRNLNRNQLTRIEAAYDESKGLIMWAVPTGTSGRLRTILAWHKDLKAWLPPMTGMEWSSFSTFVNPSTGATGLFCGDEWGRVFEMFSGDRDGVPETTTPTTLTGTVTAATPSTLTDDSASFYTDGDGLAGLPVAVRSQAGVWQWRRIESNTATQLTLDTTHDNPWTNDPVAGNLYIVGGIQWFWWTPWLDLNWPEIAKRLWQFYLQVKSTSGNHTIDVRGRFNDEDGVVTNLDLAFTAGNLSAAWASATWGESLWGILSRRGKLQRVDRSVFSAQFQMRNFYADQPIQVSAYGITGDGLKGRRATG